MKISSIKIHGIKSFEDETIYMDDYIVFVGENNSGKSNILFSLLWFFGKEKIASKDINNFVPDDPYVELEFRLLAGEEFPYPKEYLVDGKFKVRATIARSLITDKSLACEYHGYIGEKEDTIKDTKLLGWKTVAKPSFGEIIYIPSVRQLTEELKFTANTSMNQLVTKNVIARIKTEDGKMGHYSKVVESIKSLSEYISTGENSALQKLKKDISNKMLDYDRISLGFTLDPPDPDELIKSCFKPHTDVEGLDNKLPISSQGDGFQRSMLFSLIANLAELNKKDVTITQSRAIKNDCTFYIIEEPELFLHPNHQTYFRNKLEELSEDNNSQIILSSHSPYFLNNIKNYSQIKRVYIYDNRSFVAQVKNVEIKKICEDNGILMSKAKNNYPGSEVTEEELQRQSEKISQEDHIRYLLWIDPERANAFLSSKVILVEGPTEKALFAFLFNNRLGEFYDEKDTSNITIIDIVGKYHFYKFAHLLNKFHIKVWCIYDGDNDEYKNHISHELLNKYIEDLKDVGVIKGSLRLDPSLEEYLGLVRTYNPDIELYSNLENNINKCRNSENYIKICNFVRQIVNS